MVTKEETKQQSETPTRDNLVQKAANPEKPKKKQKQNNRGFNYLYKQIKQIKFKSVNNHLLPYISKPTHPNPKPEFT